MKRLPPRFWLALRLIIGTSLIIWLLRSLDWASFEHAFRQINWFWGAICVLIPLSGIPLSARKWHGVLHLFGVRIPYPRVLSLYWSGTFYNNVLPGSIGGDVVKIGGLSQDHVSLADATLSVLLDRLSGLWVGMLIGLLAALWPSNLPLREPLGLLFAGIVGGGLLGALLLPRFLQALPTRWQRFAALGPMIWQRSFLVTLGLAAAFQSLVVLHVWAAGLAFQTPLSLLASALYAQALVVITLIPISLNGIGVRETALVFFLAGLGVPPEIATLMGFTLYVTGVLASLPGGLTVVRSETTSTPD